MYDCSFHRAFFRVEKGQPQKVLNNRGIVQTGICKTIWFLTIASCNQEKLYIFEVSSFKSLLTCNQRASTLKTHELSLKSRHGFSLESEKIHCSIPQKRFLHKKRLFGDCNSKQFPFCQPVVSPFRANFLFFFLFQILRTSVLLRLVFSFTMSSAVHTSFDHLSSVMFHEHRTLQFFHFLYYSMPMRKLKPFLLLTSIHWLHDRILLQQVRH